RDEGDMVSLLILFELERPSADRLAGAELVRFDILGCDTAEDMLRHDPIDNVADHERGNYVLQSEDNRRRIRRLNLRDVLIERPGARSACLSIHVEVVAELHIVRREGFSIVPLHPL